MPRRINLYMLHIFSKLTFLFISYHLLVNRTPDQRGVDQSCAIPLSFRLCGKGNRGLRLAFYGVFLQGTPLGKGPMLDLCAENIKIPASGIEHWLMVIRLLIYFLYFARFRY